MGVRVIRTAGGSGGLVHEMSVALEVCRIAEEQLGIEALPRVTGMGLEVGNRSGIMADNLAFCLDTLLTHPPFGAARTVIRRSGLPRRSRPDADGVGDDGL